MFRTPTLAELADLFLTPSSVDAAVAMLDRAKVRVSAVATRCEELAEKAYARSGKLQLLAENHENDADRHSAEAGRAARVANRLTQLLA